MFWEKGYGSSSANIEALLQKENVRVEELLDDEDILQECKSQKRPLIQFLTRPDIMRRLIELITTEPPEDLSLAQRYKHANTACEILTFGLPSLDERLVEEPTILETLYSFLEQKPPLNPLLSSFFSKTFSMLISKKSEQDWFLYQKMCLQMLEFIKSRDNFLDLIIKHFAIPVIMDLLIQIIREVRGGALKKNLYEWLTEQKLVERLVCILGDPDESDKHSNICEFLCELIKHGRSMRQGEIDNDSFEPVFVGSNPILQVIESESLIQSLLDVMLKKPHRESSIVSGILIILTLVDESIVDEPASEKALQMIIDKEKENHHRVVSTVISAIAPRLEDFHEILLNPPTKTQALTPSAVDKAPPFGFTRLQICRLFTVLLQTGNQDFITRVCETNYFNTLLNLFKQYSWNNFLHSEVEKCFRYVFATFDQNENEGFNTNPTALQSHVIVNCKIVSKLIDCWMHNHGIQLVNGRRLGYMGHLIQILKHITLSISKSENLGALILENLSESSLNDWKSITDCEDGDLTKELETQSRFLANCDPHMAIDDGIGMIKELHNEGGGVYFIDLDSKELTDLDNQLGLSLDDDSPFDKNFCDQMAVKTLSDDLSKVLDMMDLDLFADTSAKLSETGSFNANANPWGADPFSDMPNVNSSSGSGGWADFSTYNFADFDTHFSSFANDLGQPIKFDASQSDSAIFEKSDRNANVEKIAVDSADQHELNLKNAKNLHMMNCDNINDKLISNINSKILDDQGEVDEKKEEGSSNGTQQQAATATPINESDGELPPPQNEMENENVAGEKYDEMPPLVSNGPTAEHIDENKSLPNSDLKQIETERENLAVRDTEDADKCENEASPQSSVDQQAGDYCEAETVKTATVEPTANVTVEPTAEETSTVLENGPA